jgi:hypothetical protein
MEIVRKEDSETVDNEKKDSEEENSLEGRL